MLDYYFKLRQIFFLFSPLNQNFVPSRPGIASEHVTVLEWRGLHAPRARSDSNPLSGIDPTFAIIEKVHVSHQEPSIRYICITLILTATFPITKYCYHYETDQPGGYM